MVHIKDGKYFIESLGRNPTLINGMPIEGQFLNHGDHITIGLTELVFQILEQRDENAKETPFQLETVTLEPSTQDRVLGPRLVLTTPSGKTTSYPLDKMQFLVGRSMKADLNLEDPSVSRRHCIIERRDDGFFARNISNTNPILINEQAVSEQRLYSGDQLKVGAFSVAFISDRAEDVKPARQRVVIKTREVHWALWLFAACLLLTLGGYLFYGQVYRPWKVRQKLESVSEEIAAGSYLPARDRLKDLLESHLPKEEDRRTRELLAQATLALAQKMERDGKSEEAKQFLRNYLKEYGAGKEALAIWAQLDLYRLTSGRRLEAAGKYQAALKEYAAITDDSPYFDEAQKGIRSVWLAYQQLGLKQQTMAQLLKQAEEHYLAKRYLRPVNRNAYTAYQAVLALDPDNSIALQRIEQMKAFYREEGDAYFVVKDWRRALSHFERYSLIDPDDSDIRKKMGICREGMAGTSVRKPTGRKAKQSLAEEQRRVERLLQESGAESTRIMKYLFDEKAEEGESAEPW